MKAPPKTVFITHGEEDAALTLGVRISNERGFKTYVPKHVERVDLD